MNTVKGDSGDFPNGDIKKLKWFSLQKKRKKKKKRKILSSLRCPYLILENLQQYHHERQLPAAPQIRKNEGKPAEK